MPDAPIPAGTRPLIVYRHCGDHVKVMLPGQPPIVMRPGDSLNFKYSVTTGPDGEAQLRFEAVDG